MFVRIPLIRADAALVRLDRIVAVITTDGETRVYSEAVAHGTGLQQR